MTEPTVKLDVAHEMAARQRNISVSEFCRDCRGSNSVSAPSLMADRSRANWSSSSHQD